jgi:hypothetical protein
MPFMKYLTAGSSLRWSRRFCKPGLLIEEKAKWNNGSWLQIARWMVVLVADPDGG